MTAPGGARAALRHEGFRRLAWGQAISQAGDSLTWLALILTVDRLTGSTAMIASLAVVLTLPQMGLGLVAGVLADRWDRRRTLIVSDLLRAAIVLGFLLVRRREDLWILYVLGLLHAAASVFFNPARAALTPLLVAPDELVAANSLLQTTQIVSGLAGTALAGVLVPLARSGWPAFALDAFSFAISAAFVAGIPAASGATVRTEPGDAGAGAAGVLADLREGFALLLGSRVLLAILLAFGIASLGTGAVSVLFVPFLVRTLGLPPATVALAKAAQTAGLLLGGAWALRAGARHASAITIGGGLAGIGIATVLMGASPGLPVLLVALALLGICSTPMQSATNALLQRRTPNAMLGRIESAVDTLLLAMMLGSMAAAGVLADRVGLRTVLYGAGILSIAGGLVGWAMLAPAARREWHENSPGENAEAGWIGSKERE